MKMKNIVMALLLISLVATPCYAVNVVDSILCKNVVLRANHMHILVNRVTGEVKYILLNNGKWRLLTGSWKNQIQAMYNVQTSNK